MPPAHSLLNVPHVDCEQLRDGSRVFAWKNRQSREIGKRRQRVASPPCVKATNRFAQPNHPALLFLRNRAARVDICGLARTVSLSLHLPCTLSSPSGWIERSQRSGASTPTILPAPASTCGDPAQDARRWERVAR